MMHRSARLAAAVAVPAAFALAGCGGSDAPSQEEFAQNLDEVCSDLEEQTEQIGQTDPESPEELSRQLDEVRSAIDRGIERMKSLERPEGDAGQTAERYISTVERQIEETALPAFDELEQAAKNEDPVKARAALRKLESVEESEADRLAEELGADECAEG